MDIIKIISNLKEKSILYKKYRLKITKSDFISFGLENIKKINKENAIKNEINYNKKIKYQLVNFHNVLKTNFNKEDLNNFYLNVNKLNVYIFNKKYGKDMGTYDSIDNKIRIYQNEDDVIYHELFHMASNILAKNGNYTGLCRKKGDYCIGLAINEGYTEYLTKKYFRFESDSYEFEVFVASKLEQIIGKDKLQSLYLSADLYGLIEELSKYANKKAIENFLLRLDHYSGRYNTEFISDRENKFLKLLKNNIIDFLIKCYDNKIDLNGAISLEEKTRRKYNFEKEILSEIHAKEEEIKTK